MTILHLPHRGVVTPGSPNSIGIDLAAHATAAPASAAWPVVNTAIYVPFILSEPVKVTKLFWVNGGTIDAAAEVDAGIYSDDGRLLCSTGGTNNQGSANLLVSTDIADFDLGAGLYYLALACSSVTSTFVRWALGSNQVLESLGVYSQASSIPLISAATFASGGFNYVPLVGAVFGPRTVI